MKAVIPLITQSSTQRQQAWLNGLQKAMPNERLMVAEEVSKSERKNCEIAIVANPDPNVLKLFPNLKWVQSLWAGVESLVKPSIENNFKLVRLVEPKLAETMAEAVLAWTLYLHRKMPSYSTQQKDKVWQQLPYSSSKECKVGILGLGELGKASANRLIDNNFQVLGWSQSEKKIADVKSFSGKAGLIKMIEKTHILVCLLPLTEQTKGIIDKNLLQNLPKGASIINFARGDLLKTDDLLTELKRDHLYHAVLDVFEKEPLESKSELWSHSNITVLPHISATSNIETVIEIVEKNILEYRKAGKLNSVVDVGRGY